MDLSQSNIHTPSQYSVEPGIVKQAEMRILNVCSIFLVCVCADKPVCDLSSVKCANQVSTSHIADFDWTLDCCPLSDVTLYGILYDFRLLIRNACTDT